MPVIHKVFAFLRKDLTASQTVVHTPPVQHILYPATMKSKEWSAGTLGGENDKRNSITRGANSEFRYDPADNSIPVHRPKKDPPEEHGESPSLTSVHVRDALIENAGVRKDPSTAAILTASIPVVLPIVKRIEAAQYTTEL
jgi:hypothetical protein